MATLNGTPGPDILDGGPEDDLIDALAGADRVNGGAGDDTLVGGAGDDTLDGAAGDDTADYSASAGFLNFVYTPSLAGGAGFYGIRDGSGGSDTIRGAEVILGGAAGDFINAAANFVAGAGFRIDGGAGSDLLTGGAGDDTVFGRDGDDSLSGAAGDDYIFDGPGDDSLSGGDGGDTISYAISDVGVTVSLAIAGAQDTRGAGIDTLSGFEALAGSLEADSLTGSAAADSLFGSTGNDTLAGDDGDDYLDGSSTDDVIEGGTGDDTLVGGFGDDSLSGGDGLDTAVYASAQSGVAVSLAATGAQNTGGPSSGVDTLSGIERLAGSRWNDSLTGSAGADTLEGGRGADVLAGGGGVDTAYYSSGQAFDSPDGTFADPSRRSDLTVAWANPVFMGDALALVDGRAGGAGADTVSGVEFFAFTDGTVSLADLLGGQARTRAAPPAATVVGTGADDRLQAAGGGGDVVDGLGGRDWLDLTARGARGSDVRTLADGSVTVAGAGRVDAMHNVEEVRFLDGRVVYDPADPAAQVVRLYDAALGRAPEQAGFNFWVEAVQGGRSLSGLASDFLASAEFAARFGDVSGAGAFVDRLYQNVSGRAGDAGGREFWARALDGGASRADVLVAFSESVENMAGTAGLVQTGVWDRSEAAAEVARLYDTVFGRRPDVEGLAFWKAALEGGTATLAQTADAFTGSAEFRAQYGSLGNRQFADALYNNALDRPADQAGLDHWAARLDAGMARSAVVLGFSEGAEHAALTAAGIQSDDPQQFGIAFA